MPTLRTIRRSVLVLGLALAALPAFACDDAGPSVIIFHLDTDPSVVAGAATSVRVVVNHASTEQPLPSALPAVVVVRTGDQGFLPASVTATDAAARVVGQWKGTVVAQNGTSTSQDALLVCAPAGGCTPSVSLGGAVDAGAGHD